MKRNLTKKQRREFNYNYLSRPEFEAIAEEPPLESSLEQPLEPLLEAIPLDETYQRHSSPVVRNTLNSQLKYKSFLKITFFKKIQAMILSQVTLCLIK